MTYFIGVAAKVIRVSWETPLSLFSADTQSHPGCEQDPVQPGCRQINIESCSRVLESLVFNIMARIDDILYVDDLTRHTDKLTPSPTVNLIAQWKSCFPYSVPVSSSPYKSSAFSTPSFSQALISPARGDRTPFILNNAKPPRHGFGVRRVLNNYLGVELRPKLSSSSMESIGSTTTTSSNDRSSPSDFSKALFEGLEILNR